MRADMTVAIALTAMIGSNLAAIAQSVPQANPQQPDLPLPTIFAPGVISGPQNDGTPSFSRDGRVTLFERTLGNRTIIYEAHREGAFWSRPRVAAFSGPSNDRHPVFAPDGSYVVYASVRPKAGTGTGPSSRNVAHLWRTNRTSRGWGTPFELPGTVNISNRIFRPSVAANVDLYFMSASETGLSGPRWRLYWSARSGSGYARAEALPFSDGKAADVDPYIAPDGSYLLFNSQGRETPDNGHEHLYFVRRVGSGWGEVHALRYTGDRWSADDGEAVVSPSGRPLLFTSTRSATTNTSTVRATMPQGVT